MSTQHEIKTKQETLDEINWLYDQIEIHRTHKIMLTTAVIALLMVTASLGVILYIEGLTKTLM